MISHLITAGLTDIGRRRESNQDHFLVADVARSIQIAGSSLPLEAGQRVYGSPLSRLILVADGMGGHQAGARASAQAIESVVHQLLDCPEWFDLIDNEQLDQFALRIDRLFRAAHRSLETASKSDPNLKGMGTTLTLVYIAWPRMLVVHAGDSRCYLMRNGQLKVLTKDHTIASQLVTRGELREEDAASSPWGNMLWNVLGGGGTEVRPEMCTVDLKMEDWVLVCSDGLNKHLSDEEIQRHLIGGGEPSYIAQQLIQSANEKGGVDNVTVVLTRAASPLADPTGEFPKSPTTVAGDVAKETIDHLSPSTTVDMDDSAPQP
jgi:serine/threonine protein phosphatase PrpC